MKFALKTVKQSEKPSENRDMKLYVRKNCGTFAAYYAVTSLVAGFAIAAAVFLFIVSDQSKHGKHKSIPINGALLYFLVVLGVLAAITFLIQLITGPFVFTKDVVCRKCHRRLRVNRIAFFTGKYSRPPRCECGGKIEPAFLWKPDISSASTN